MDFCMYVYEKLKIMERFFTTINLYLVIHVQEKPVYCLYEISYLFVISLVRPVFCFLAIDVLGVLH